MTMPTGRLYVGTRKGLFAVTRRQKEWSIDRVDFLGAQVPIVLPVADTAQVFAALKHGHFGAKVHRSDNGGLDWTEIAVPTYPEKPADVPDVIDPMRGVPIPWSLDMIWSMEKGADGRLWCGTLPGGLFTSDDDGQSWSLNLPLWNRPERASWFGGGYDYAGIHSICIDPRNANHVKIAISCGGVWGTEDSGMTWRCQSEGMRADYMPPEQAFDPNIQDPHLMVQCVAEPDYLWIQHHNGIFLSTDNSEHWNEIPPPRPSAFGFAVAVHPNNPSTAWFVPAVRDSDRYPVDGRFVVTRTQDGGESFEILQDGLPQTNAYHLVYRHALAIDNSGEVLAMGSTTGGLWISENAGVTWKQVTNDLPPIFTIRFGQ